MHAWQWQLTGTALHLIQGIDDPDVSMGKLTVFQALGLVQRGVGPVK